MRHWLRTADHQPPTGEPVLVAWNPRHLSRPIGVARLETGYSWYSEGQRMPIPLYWMRLPALPDDLSEVA